MPKVLSKGYGYTEEIDISRFLNLAESEHLLLSLVVVGVMTMTAMLVGVKSLSSRLLAEHAEEKNKSKKQRLGAEEVSAQDLGLRVKGGAGQDPQPLSATGGQETSPPQGVTPPRLGAYAEEDEDFDDFGHGFVGSLQQRLASAEKKSSSPRGSSGQMEFDPSRLSCKGLGFKVQGLGLGS